MSENHMTRLGPRGNRQHSRYDYQPDPAPELPRAAYAAWRPPTEWLSSQWHEVYEMKAKKEGPQ